MRPESAATGRNMSWFSVAALAVVPLLVIGALLGLVNRPAEGAASAAIVNLDEPVTVHGMYVPMGRQLAAAIVDESDDDIEWVLADAKSASEGLRSGEYSVVVTIPQEFSAAATSFSENDAATATQATIGLDVGANSPITDAQIGEQIARIATGTIGATLTESYLENVFIGLNSVGEQFGQITDAVGQLGDGASQLADGTGQAADGASELAVGLGLLAEGAGPLTAGGSQLASGSGELASGASQLSQGASQLNDGIDQFAAQAPALVDGVDQLAGGAQALLGGIPDFASGSKQVVLGVGQLAGGLEQMITGLDNSAADWSALDQLTAGAGGVAQGTAGVSSGLESVNGLLGGFAAGDAQAQGVASQITAGVSAAFQCPIEDPATCAMLSGAFESGAAAAALEGVKAGAGVGVQALNTPQDGVTLLGAASQVATGASQLSEGVGQLATELPAQTAAQMGELRAGLVQLQDGANQIVTQAQPIVDNADALGAGATSLLAGINQLNGEISALPAGVDQLAGGAAQLSSGASQLAGGASELSAGVGQYVDGVGQFASGATQAAEGAPVLVEGLTQLADGATQLDYGVGEFGSELAAGAADLPNYTDSDRATLSQVVATPVKSPAGVAGLNSTAGVALLIVAGLWLAAMLAFVMVRPVPANVVTSRASSATLWARTIGLPALVVALQGVVFGVIGGTLLDLNLGSTIILAVLLAALGLSFVLANHALTAWLGNWGRGIAAILLAAAIAVAISSVGSTGLDWLNSISPLQNAFLMVRTYAADGAGMVGFVGTAMLIGIIAAAASVFAIASRRTLSVAQYRRRIDS